MKTLKNMIPFFLLMMLIAVTIMVLTPEKSYKLKFEEVTKVYTVDYTINKKYNHMIVDLLDGIELVKDNGFNGIYKFLYIKDVNGTKELCIFDNGKIAYRKGDNYYMVTNKEVTDKINRYIKIYNVDYLDKVLFINELDKKYTKPADRVINQQDATSNIRFIFNREISHLKIKYIDRIKVPGSCVWKGSVEECEYEFVEKVISNQKYVMYEGETLDFKFNKEAYRFGLTFEIADFNGEVSIMDVTYDKGNVFLGDVYVKEEE